MERREFISKVAAAGIGAAATGALSPAEALPAGRLTHRAFGNSGRALSIIGLGGIVVSQVEQSEANATVAWAQERGVNYYDVAPSYGNAQERLGPALQPFRDGAFLACKTGKRDAAGAQAELEESLRLLQTDYLDLYQLHGVTKVDEVDAILGPEGAMETFARARDKGLVKYIGFSAHSEEAAVKLLDSFDFDSLLFPFNAVCIEGGQFGPVALKKAAEKGVSCLALKAIAWTTWPKEGERKYPKCWYQPSDDPELASLLLRYTLDLPVVSAVPPGDARLFKLCVEAALKYKPLQADERQDLVARLQGVEPIFRTTA